MRLEVLGGRFVPANFHKSKLFPLPFYESALALLTILTTLCNGHRDNHTIEVCGTDEGDVNAQISVISRAIQAQVYPERNRRPSRVLGAAIKACLSWIQSVSLIPAKGLVEVL